MSIGYFIVDDEPNGYGGRNLKQIELIEISIVEEPADLGASITGIKSKLEKAESLADIEASLRDAGFSRSSATALVSRIKTLAQRDVEQEVAAEQKSAFQQLQDYLNLLTEGNKP